MSSVAGNQPKDGNAPRRRRILIVDDHEDSAEGMAVLLRACGHEARAAHDAHAALEAAEEYRPDVVILDIGLPGMDGFEAARRLRERFPSHPLRLVALTGYGQEEDRRRAREAGFDHHLVKPLDIARLRELIEAD
jgi:CheY-like chemotaxis protein